MTIPDAGSQVYVAVVGWYDYDGDGSDGIRYARTLVGVFRTEQAAWSAAQAYRNPPTMSINGAIVRQDVYPVVLDCVTDYVLIQERR